MDSNPEQMSYRVVEHSTWGNVKSFVMRLLALVAAGVVAMVTVDWLSRVLTDSDSIEFAGA